MVRVQVFHCVATELRPASLAESKKERETELRLRARQVLTVGAQLVREG
jgi:hypothetical protein